MIQIDKKVPVPAATIGAKGKYPWAKLAIGDSFFVAGKTSGDMASSAQGAGFRRGRKFTCRTVTENGVKGVRVWRTE